VKIPGSVGKNTLGGVDGSNTDMGLLTSWGSDGNNEQIGFSGVPDPALKLADGEGADDDPAGEDEN